MAATEEIYVRRKCNENVLMRSAYTASIEIRRLPLRSERSYSPA
jgi:hypothetical protein